jgi:hypothetical protein
VGVLCMEWNWVIIATALSYIYNYA